MGATTIYFVRHGTVENPQNIFYGNLPSYRLSADGLRQARALIPFFLDKSISRIISSPLLRARQTARVIAENFQQAKISTSSFLLEIRTPNDGLLISEMEARNWDLYSGNLPPYEQPGDVLSRSLKFVKNTLHRSSGQQIIAVTHADVIVFLSLWANGYEVNYPNKSLIEHKKIKIQFPAPASVTTLTFQDEKMLPDFEYFQNE
jgi:broad specificity phosphatase PhoE